MVSLGLIAAGVGAITNFIGNDAQEDAEKARVRAERQRDAALFKNTARVNELNKKLAKNKYNTAKKTAKLYENYAKDRNAYVKDATDKLNELVVKRVEAQNKGVEAQEKRIQAEYDQAKMNNLRDRRENVRNALMTLSATTAASANKGALGGSGYKAGKADVGTQLTRAQAASMINIGILDTLRHADQLFAAAQSEANMFEAEAITLKNKTDARLQIMENKYQTKAFNQEVAGMGREYKLTERLYNQDTRAARINSFYNSKTGEAKSDFATGQSISSIGAKIGEVASLFG